MTVQEVRFEGATVRCHVTGNGPPLLLLHNAGNDHRNWDRQVEALAAHRQVWAVDMIGFGSSDKPEGPYPLERFARQIGAIADTLDASTLDLVGHCVGGAACLRWAVDHPDRVSRLVLFSPATLASMRAGPYGWLYAATASTLGERWVYGLAKLAIRSRLTRRASILAQFGTTDAEPSFEAHCDALYANPENLRVLRQVLADFSTFGCLDGLGAPPEVPVMLVWGTRNRILPFHASAPIRVALAPQVDLVLPGAGHLCMREQPHIVNPALLAFLGID